MTTTVERLPAWQRLRDRAREVGGMHVRDLFAQDPERFSRFSWRHGQLFLDLSRQRLTPAALDDLLALAGSVDLQGWIDRLFAGEEVNNTEQQAALHPALRMPAGSSLLVDGVNLVPAVERERQSMAAMVSRLHDGHWRGYSGRAITDIVNIGVGGSDLGPAMACEALRDFSGADARKIRVHFASSMDGSQLDRLLRVLDPQSTLFIVSSKSFTTADTLANARTAREWLLAHHADEETLLRLHFIGVTATPAKACAWGIPEENLLLFWRWVGGRYSLWSTIGFPIALQLGMDGFRDLLAGAHDMDEHFQRAPFPENLPVLLGLAAVWNSTFLGIRAQAILPYDGRLSLFPAYLEQLAMESNGKSVDRDGNAIGYSTCPVLWGGVGPNAQHAFYQLLHQGTVPVTCDFIAPVRRHFPVASEQARRELQSQHRLSLANCLAQARLLAMGDEGGPSSQPLWRRYHGNQPSTTLLMDELSPWSLGALIALYEHRVFVESVLWNINPFDQWGVELGKTVASETLAVLDDGGQDVDDMATRGLILEIRRISGKAGG